MKKNVIFAFVLLTSQVAIAQSAELLSKLGMIQYEPRISHVEDVTVRIRISKAINTQSLSLMDKLKFKEKHSTRKHFEFINESGHATHDILTVSDANIYPKWYSPPVLIRSDERGMTSFFDNTSKYLKDGWTGGVVSTTELGSYKKDMDTNTRCYQQEYSPLAAEYYKSKDELVSQVGFLYQYVYQSPSLEDLDELSNLGFGVSSETGKLAASNEQLVFTWDTLRRIYIKQIVESEKIVETIKSYYTYDSLFGTYLLSKQVVIESNTFDNGDCYETVTETAFLDYSNTFVDERSLKESPKEQQKSSSSLTVLPNPTSGNFTLTFPSSKASSIMKIYDISGQMIKQRKLPPLITSHEVYSEDLKQGVYFVKIQQGGSFFSVKFVKQ